MTKAQWLLGVMGKHDFTMPQAAFDEIMAALSASIADTAGAKPVAWARADVPERLKSPRAYSATTELLKERKDGYIPLYAAPPAPSVADAPAEFTERERFVWNLGYSAGKEETVCGSFEEFFDVSWKRGDCIEDAKPAMRRAWDAATNRAANVAQKCMHGKTYEEHGRTNWNNGIAEAVDAIRALAPEAASSSVADAAVVFYGGQSTAPCVSFDEGAPSVADAKSRSLGKWTITKPKMDGSGGCETYITHYAKEARDAGIAGWGVAEHFELIPVDLHKEVAKLIFLLRTTPEKFDDETLMQLDSVEYGIECARNAVADAAGASEPTRWQKAQMAFGGGESPDATPSRTKLCTGSHIMCEGREYCLGEPSCKDLAAKESGND